MSDTTLGGWSPYHRDISQEAANLFEKLVGGIVGKSYTPVAMATQIVAGKNYSFFCNAKIVAPHTPNEIYFIKIHQPLEGEPHLVEIKQVVLYPEAAQLV